MTHAIPTDTMTIKERWLAAVRCQPVDRLPFWPKLNGSYPPARQAPFREMTLPAIQAWIGTDPHVGVRPCLRQVFRRCGHEVVQLKPGLLHRIIFKTPHGELALVNEFDEPSQAWHPIEHPVKSLEDIKAMTAWYEDQHPEVNPEELKKGRAAYADIGSSAVTMNNLGTSALMDWVERLAGIETANYLLADHPDAVAALFDAIHQNMLRRAHLIAEHQPGDLIYMMENTSTTLISVEQYRRLCYPHIAAYARILADAGRLPILHMCGHVKALLPDLAKLPVAGFEAFTAPTLGNTTLLDGRSACPDKCLIGGTHAMLWLEPANKIIAQIEAWLDELPHHRGLVITSAGVMPPACEPETIKAVCDWVKSYPARM